MNGYELLGRLLGIERVQAIDGIEGRFAASWAQANGSRVLLACAAVSAIAIFFYLRYQPRGKLSARVNLGIVRAVLLSLLVIFLAEPVLLLKLTQEPRPLLWVLFDGSDSMNMVDELQDSEQVALAEAVALKPKTAGKPGSPGAAQPEASKPTRLEYVQALVQKPEQNLLSKLEEKFRVRAFTFDRADGVRALARGNSGEGEAEDPLVPAQLASQLTATGEVTALGAAFSDLQRRFGGSQLAGLVVVSDFDQNSGPPPLESARRLGVPIYTLGVGPTTAVDLAVDLQAPLLMKKAERSSLNVTLRQTGLEGRTVQVQVKGRRVGAMGSMLDEEKFVIGSRTLELNVPTVNLDFPFLPEKTGRFILSAEVDQQPGEVVDQNNLAEREVNVRDDFLRLMFVEYEPTWEWRFIKEVFHRDALVGMRGFRTFLRSADPKVRQTSELFLPTLTPARSDFFASDVIFLGDMPATTLSARFCAMTKEFVSTFGGGLVIVSGPRFGPAQLAQTPLADMLPVIVDPDAARRDDKEFALKLTPEAEAFDFMQLGGGNTPEQRAANNAKAWDNLKALPWYQPVARLHPLATALAVHPTDKCVDGKTPQPLIAVRRYGRGEVIYIGFNETWRLRKQYGELYYRQFWGQMIHRLGLSHALGTQKRFVVRTDRQQYQADDKVILTVEAYDANFEPLAEDKLADHKLTAELLVPGRQPGDEPTTQQVSIPQLREGVFETRIPIYAGGEHRVRVKDPVTNENSEVEFQVTQLSAERRSAVRNVALEKELAVTTGGRNYDLLSVNKLPAEIPYHPQIETSIRVVPLWNTWLSFVVVVTLMLVEWLVRKLVNLA